MTQTPVLVLFVVLLGAVIWNFAIASTAPQIIPRTRRGCAIMAGVEGTIIGSILLVVEMLVNYPSNMEFAVDAVRYIFAWSLLSAVTKNQYRRQNAIHDNTEKSDETAFD
jgi:hypothetical protein